MKALLRFYMYEIDIYRVLQPKFHPFAPQREVMLSTTPLTKLRFLLFRGCVGRFGGGFGHIFGRFLGRFLEHVWKVFGGTLRGF